MLPILIGHYCSWCIRVISATHMTHILLFHCRAFDTFFGAGLVTMAAVGSSQTTSTLKTQLPFHSYQIFEFFNLYRGAQSAHIWVRQCPLSSFSVLKPKCDNSSRKLEMIFITWNFQWIFWSPFYLEVPLPKYRHSAAFSMFEFGTGRQVICCNSNV